MSAGVLTHRGECRPVWLNYALALLLCVAGWVSAAHIHTHNDQGLNQYENCLVVHTIGIDSGLTVSHSLNIEPLVSSSPYSQLVDSLAATTPRYYHVRAPPLFLAA